jgi:hypothetical protein
MQNFRINQQKEVKKNVMTRTKEENKNENNY